ncbi:hypothetical protein D3C86_2098330 [compost metagenome]
MADSAGEQVVEVKQLGTEGQVVDVGDEGVLSQVLARVDWRMAGQVAGRGVNAQAIVA